MKEFFQTRINCDNLYGHPFPVIWATMRGHKAR